VLEGGGEDAEDEDWVERPPASADDRRPSPEHNRACQCTRNGETKVDCTHITYLETAIYLRAACLSTFHRLR
jgi:hypothetical protein